MDFSWHGHEGEVPIPITSTYIVHHHHNSSSAKATTKPPPHSLSSTIIAKEEEEEQEQRTKKNVRYRECLRNHAASMGGNSTDGCCEFMPSGEEGSLEALKCSACSCHRNFHKKEVEGDHDHDFHHYNYNYNYNYIPRSASALVGYIQRPHPPPAALIMPLGAIHTSESDDNEDGYGFLSHPPQRTMMMKKRFRTKFSQEQKEKMLGFAESVGWKLQRQEEGEVQKLCQEIGVKRRVLKVWMHNNKHNYLAKKNTTTAAPLVQ